MLKVCFASLWPSVTFSLSLSLSIRPLRDVGYGVADFQTPPVDGPRHGEEREHGQQHPRHVDPFGVLGRSPRSHQESGCGGRQHHEQQEAQQAPPSGVASANGGDFTAVRTSSQGAIRKLCPQECIGAVSTDDSDADGLMLRFRTVPANVDWPQVDDTFTVWSRTGDPLRRDLADQQAVTRTADVLLSDRSVLYRRGFVADAALHHMLVGLPLHRDGALTHPAADDWGAAAVRAAMRRVRWRRLARRHRAGERRQTVGLRRVSARGEAAGSVVLLGQQWGPFPVRHRSQQNL